MYKNSYRYISKDIKHINKPVKYIDKYVNYTNTYLNMTPASEPKQTSLGTSGGVCEAFGGYVGGIWEELWQDRATTGGPEAS